MCGVPLCTKMFVSKQPFCLRGNLLCHLLAGRSLIYVDLWRTDMWAERAES